MRVLLISANTEPINMPTMPVGLSSVAAASRNAGYEVELLDLMRASEMDQVKEVRFDMLKKLAKKLFGGSPSVQPSEGFFLNVRCSACGELFRLFINKTTDLLQNFDENGRMTYSLKKEIIGGICRNLIHVKMEFDGAKNLVSKEIENGEFIEDSEI